MHVGYQLPKAGIFTFRAQEIFGSNFVVAYSLTHISTALLPQSLKHILPIPIIISSLTETTSEQLLPTEFH